MKINVQITRLDAHPYDTARMPGLTFGGQENYLKLVSDQPSDSNSSLSVTHK